MVSKKTSAHSVYVFQMKSNYLHAEFIEYILKLRFDLNSRLFFKGYNATNSHQFSKKMMC